ncbi:MAG: bifunctional riboflavin kinase/FAD synthetase, partial [Muribaculaceae bacterium]|nr:bifunctional riboflavin kinase/FAD synthetase [Muribaculaceae bacterium]
ATVGMFDGVHAGHRFLLDFISQEAARRNLSTQVITFTNHPLSIVRPEAAPKLLSSPEQKLDLILSNGIDDIILLDFTPELQNLSAQQFLKLLRDNFDVTHLAMGFNNSFGNDRTLKFEDFKRIGKETGIEIILIPEFTEKNNKVSSSVIRRLINDGDVASASKLLGRKFSLTGKVVHGRNVGHTIGFPTANISPSFDSQIIPAKGVYAGKINIDGTDYKTMVNIGVRPTFDSSDKSLSIEAYIDNFTCNLYDKTLTIQFINRLRDEMKFASIDQLKHQLTTDLQNLRQIPINCKIDCND